MNIANPREFTDFLLQVNRGSLAEQLAVALRDVVAAIEDADSAGHKSPSGTITLKLNIKKDEDRMEVRPDVTVKVPKKVLQKSIFYATPDNGLTRVDPRQKEMDLKIIDGPTVRNISGT